MKLIRVALAALAVLSLLGCSAADPLDDLYTKNIYPGTNSTYQIGDNATAYSQGWFDNLYITDNTSLFDFNGVPLVFNGTSGNVSVLNDLTDVTITSVSVNETLRYNGAQWVNDNVTAGSSYTDEQAQDAVGTILTGSSSIDFIYNDGVPSITASANITTGTSTNITGLFKGNGTTISAATAGTDYLVSPLTADLNFAEYKAIALVCDNGATVPAGPTKGQWYLHTPTGRNILMQYDGSNWIPIISLGTMTLYVDNTDGTDAMDKGGAVDAGAVKTAQYAVNLIPGLVGGNVVININAETYAETVTIQGKSLTGAYTITFQGTLTSLTSAAQDSSVQGAGATFGSITDAGGFGAYDNKLLYSSNNNEYRIIDSDTANTATIIGYWSAAPAGNYTVYDWGTVVTNAIVGINQVGIIVNDMKLTAAWGTGLKGSSMLFNRCWTNLNLYSEGLLLVQYSYLLQPNADATLQSLNGLAFVDGCKIASTNDNGIGIYASNMAMIRFANFTGQPSVLDGVAGGNKGVYGVYADGGSAVNVGYVYNIIRNWDTGCLAIRAGSIYYTPNNQYSGNGTNETSTAASYAFVD